MTDPYRYVCPSCRTSQYWPRHTKDPTYRCRCGHEFDEPFDKKHGECRLKSHLIPG